jgi:hypothetical protein
MMGCAGDEEAGRNRQRLAGRQAGSGEAAGGTPPPPPRPPPLSAARAWDDEPRHAVQLLLGADLHRLHARDAAQQRHVLPKAALQRQHADPDGLHSACCG